MALSLPPHLSFIWRPSDDDEHDHYYYYCHGWSHSVVVTETSV